MSLKSFNDVAYIRNFWDSKNGVDNGVAEEVRSSGVFEDSSTFSQGEYNTREHSKIQPTILLHARKAFRCYSPHTY